MKPRTLFAWLKRCWGWYDANRRPFNVGVAAAYGSFLATRVILLFLGLIDGC